MSSADKFDKTKVAIRSHNGFRKHKIPVGTPEDLEFFGLPRFNETPLPRLFVGGVALAQLQLAQGPKKIYLFTGRTVGSTQKVFLCDHVQPITVNIVASTEIGGNFLLIEDTSLEGFEIADLNHGFANRQMFQALEQNTCISLDDDRVAEIGIRPFYYEEKVS